MDSASLTDSEPPDKPSALLLCLAPAERPSGRILFFPHAGGSATVYAPWVEQLSSQAHRPLELWAVQPPGRPPRARQPPFATLDELALAVTDAIIQNDLYVTPLVLFGHSFGSLAAYAVARAMADAGLPAPICLIVSGHEPPTCSVPSRQAGLSALPDKELWNALRIWDFVPPLDAANPAEDEEAQLASLAPLLVPVRADLELREAYLTMAHQAERPPPLPMPIHPIGGSQDSSLDRLALSDWRLLGNTNTAAPADLLPGGHFYLHAKYGGPSTSEVLQLIVRLTFEALDSLPLSVVSGPALDGLLPQRQTNEELYVHEMFLRAAERTPGALALVHAEGELSYDELRAEVVATAGWLVLHGARPRAVVAVLLEHRYESLVAQLAVGLSGAAFFPLETHLGPKALADLLASAAPVALLTSAKHISRLPADVAPILNFDTASWRQTVREGAACAPDINLWPRAAMYDPGIVTMTSGTTGVPKTVLNPMISYAVAVVAREQRYPYTTTLEREATNVMFSWEAARPLAYGCTALVLPDEATVQPAQMRHLLESWKATRILTTPSLLAAFLELGFPEVSNDDATARATARASGAVSQLLPHMHTWLLCGEVTPSALVQRMARTLPHIRLVNDYSSWEACDTAYSTLLRGDGRAESSSLAISIDRPLPSSLHRIAPAGEAPAGVAFALLDPQTLVPVPRGCLGEMFVLSPQAFTGYAQAPELTAARLVPVPPPLLAAVGLDATSTSSTTRRLLLAHGAEARRQAEKDGGSLAIAESEHENQIIYMYKTGDLARLLPPNTRSSFPSKWTTCQVLGRIDSTIKIRGYKIGLAWVEATIGGLPGVARCAVATLDDEATRQPIALVAHVWPDWAAAAAAAVDQARWLGSIRNAAKVELPPHALPVHWMVTKELGTLSASESRKLDRKKLPKPSLAPPPPPALIESVSLSSMGGALAIEASMLGLWTSVLGVPAVLPNDNFFDLGGHSLLAAKLVAALQASLGIECTVLDLFEAPTPADLAHTLSARREAIDGPARPLVESAQPLASRSLAIVGTEGRYPRAADTEAYWRLLLSGRDALTLWSAAELAAQGVSPDVFSHPRWVPAAYMVDGAEFFDAAFWSLSPHEAAIMDPQHRLFLEVAWATFERAGYAPRNGTPRRTAVVAAAGIDGYMHHHLDGAPLKDGLAPGDIFLGEIGSEKDYIATRVSYALDLMGPSISVNSACSSGLLAVAQAAQTILTGQAELALGGASALSFPSYGYLFEDGLVASIDGRVRPFDAAAHGTVFGDAVGAVLLKTLSAAEADADDILATILGFGIANDGSRKAGYAAPGVAGQRATVSAALAHAAVSAASLTMVECHATGTLVGDGIEARSLTDAFANAGAGPAEVATRGSFCAIGSVKGNVGHANAAAGMTGLLKAALCLKNQTLVPTAHFMQLNKNVMLDGTALHVFQGASAPWVAPRLASKSLTAARRCGISSFGIGGTNVHMVLEEASSSTIAPQATANAASSDVTSTSTVTKVHTLCVSARTHSAAGRAAARLAMFLREEEARGGAASPLEVVARQLLTRREAFQHRIAVAVTTRHAAISALEAAAADIVLASTSPLRRSLSSSSVTSAASGASGSSSAADAASDAPTVRAPPRSRSPPPVVLIFPGQGSQCVRMGEGLYRTEPSYRRHLDRICELLRPDLGFDLRERLFPPTGAEHDPEFRAIFDSPIVAQPAIFATELALGRMLIEDYGIMPTALAGHSIGEFVAATLAGIWTDAEGARLISLRARSSEKAPLGAMLAAVTSASRAADLVAMAAHEGRIFLAVENSVERQVLAGEDAAVRSAQSVLQEDGIKSRRLPISRAYHTPLMSGVADALAEALCSVQLKPPRVRMVCNGTGDWMDASTSTDPTYWARHVASPVRWATNMEKIAELAVAGGAFVVEVGSGGSLAPLFAECSAAGASQLKLLSTLRSPRLDAGDGTPDGIALATTLCALWEANLPFGLAAARYPAGRFARVQLPTYPFERAVHWVNPQRSMYVRESFPIQPEDSSPIPSPSQPQLVRLKHAADGRRWVSAYCLAYAGGSVQAFSELAAAAPEWMEVVAIETPGKGVLADALWPADGLSGDPEAERTMISELAKSIEADAAGSALVLVGWSMGGMLATELAIHLQNAGAPPQLLHVAGRMAPGSFIIADEASLESYNLAPEQIRQTAAYREWLLPTLLADLRADSRAEARVHAALKDAPPLRCELQLCCGDADAAFPPSAAAAWLPYFSCRHSVHTLEGGHDILQGQTIKLLDLLVSRLLPQSPLYAIDWVPIGNAEAAPNDLEDESDAQESLSMHSGERPATISMGTQLLVLGSTDVKLSARCVRAASSPGGLLIYVVPQPDLQAQLAQTSAFLSLVISLADAGGGRLVLICSADSMSSLPAGASKAVPLEYPEISVQRLYLDAEADLLRSSSKDFATNRFVRDGWVAWLASVAASARVECDMRVRSSGQPLMVPRLAPLPVPAPATDSAIDSSAVYLITGGSGGLGGALVDWLLDVQHVPPVHVVLLSRRGQLHPRGVSSIAANLSDAASLSRNESLTQVLRELDGRPLGGIFHLAGVLDDGLIANLDERRVASVVSPKAGIFPLLSLCKDMNVSPPWVLLASSTSSLFGYAGQANYCAANALLDQAATFGLSDVDISAGAQRPRILTINFGPWGEVGMAREGTKAHALSLASGETPMSSADAIGCMAQALRAIRSGTPSEPGPNLQFCIAQVQWWRSPWPDHPLVQGVLRRTPASLRQPPASPAALAAPVTPAPSAVSSAVVVGSTATGLADGRARAEAWMRGRLSEWDPESMLAALGLDSLDLVQLRNAFNKHFRTEVALSIFSNASQTLNELLDRVGKLV